jgi:hypothetical protein
MTSNGPAPVCHIGTGYNQQQEHQGALIMVNKVVLVALLSALLTGCGGGISTTHFPGSAGFTPLAIPAGAILAADIFSAPVGKQWDMMNDLGDVTHFSIESAPGNDACETGNHIAIHITKTMARTYWGVGLDGASTHFNMSIDSDGSYRGIADISQHALSLDMATINWRPAPLHPLPYMIVPPYFVRGQTQTTSTFYRGFLLRHVNTNSCIVGNSKYLGQIDWKSSFYEGAVDTPVYKGWAMVSEQWENCTDPQFHGGCGAHEKWYFAPGVGLVQIDSAVTIKRIN